MTWLPTEVVEFFIEAALVTEVSVVRADSAGP